MGLNRFSYCLSTTGGTCLSIASSSSCFGSNIPAVHGQTSHDPALKLWPFIVYFSILSCHLPKSTDDTFDSPKRSLNIKVQNKTWHENKRSQKLQYNAFMAIHLKVHLRLITWFTPLYSGPIGESWWIDKRELMHSIQQTNMSTSCSNMSRSCFKSKYVQAVWNCFIVLSYIIWMVEKYVYGNESTVSINFLK